MTKNRAASILVFFKLFLLSLLFCLPKIGPIESTESFLKFQPKSEIHSPFISHQANFEQKLIKKIPLFLDGFFLTKTFDPHFTIIALEDSTPIFTFSKTCHFITSSFARAPPHNS